MEHLKDNGNLIERGTKRIPFDVTFTKGDIKTEDMFFANEFSHLVERQTTDPHKSALIEQAISAVKEPILGQAVKVFGRDLSGVEIKIKPNFHDLVDDEKIINDYMEKVESYYEDQPNEIMKHREHAEAALNHHKSELPEFFPGYEKEIVPNVYNEEIKEAVEKVTWHYCTIAIAEEAQKDINETIKGFEQTHNLKPNEQAFFIVMNKDDGQEKVKTIAVDKSLPLEGQKLLIKNEARDFVLENVKNRSQLTDISVRAEKANDLYDTNQQEFYQEIGRQENSMSMQNQVEMSK